MNKSAIATAAALGLAASATAFAQDAHDGVDRHHGDSHYAVEVLSGRPDAVTGGDALVRVSVGKKVSPSQTRVKLNGADVTSSFVVGGNALTGPGFSAPLADLRAAHEGFFPRLMGADAALA